jgi:aldose sugar dehydrogenase
VKRAIPTDARLRPRLLARRVVMLAASSALLAACFEASPAAVEAHERRGVRTDTFARGLVFPWSLAFLPDGRMLVTEREGRLRIVSATGAVSAPLAGVPAVVDSAYNGLLDIAVHPKFRENHFVFFTFTEPRGEDGATAVARARLGAEGLSDVQIIFRQTPAYDYAAHNGSRLAFGPDGALYVTLGDRNRSSTAQALDTHNGKIVRIAMDGAALLDNPYAGRSDARPEIWATGLRNSQGLAFEPGAGRLWAVDHGPNDGDELNIITRGANYGWPLETAGTREPDERPTRELAAAVKAAPRATVAPVRTWTPSIAPSGLMFYTGSAFPDWRGNLFVGGLAGKVLLRLRVNDGRVVSEERLLGVMNERIRDVKQGPDGTIYVLTDNAEGRILRLSPTS